MTMPFRPRPDRGSPPHERARQLVAERLDGPLETGDATWLEGHLAVCQACRSLGEELQADRLELQTLRRQAIEPPRDLWARTSAALDREAGLGAQPRRRRRMSPAPVGAAAGLLVVAVVVGASMLSGLPSRPVPSAPAPSRPLTAATTGPTVGTSTAAPSTPEPTRLAVPPGEVDYVAQDDAGNTSYFTVNVDEVCTENGAQCGPVVASSPLTIDLPDSPHAVIRSPEDGNLVVLDGGTEDTGGAVLLVEVPTPGSSDPPASAPPPSEEPTTEPSLSPSPTATAASPTPTASTEPSPSVSPSPSPSPTVSVEPSLSPTPSIAVSPSASLPIVSPSASAEATPFAIAEDVIVDAATAAFSPDGEVLAFSARPADGAHGPDIYIWTADGDVAMPLTTDHRSVFAGWLGDAILGSRVVEEAPAAAPTESSGPAASAGGEIATPPNVPLRPEAFLLDPDTGEVTVIVGRRVWRPSVDPSRTLAVYWDGSLEVDESGDWQTTRGQLVVGPWSGMAVAPAASPGVAASPDASADPSGSASVSPEPTAPLSAPPSQDPTEDGVQVLADGPIRHWDAQWDETGTHLAVWIADPDDPEIGKLSLYVVDPDSGRLETDAAPLRDERALPGFAIGEGRLVWATPPGQDAESSHVQVLAWTDAGMGQVESQPAEDIVVVR